MTTKAYLNNGTEVEIEFYYHKGHVSKKSHIEEPDDDPYIEMVSVVTKDGVEMIHKIETKEYDSLLDDCWEYWKGRQ